MTPPAAALSLRVAATATQGHTHQLMYRGRCKYKSGKCTNERSTKDNGLPHTLCEPHRLQHNKNQRKSDVKRRRQKRLERGGKKPLPGPKKTTPPSATTQSNKTSVSLQPVKDEVPEVVAVKSPASIVEPLKWSDDWSFDELIILRDMIM